MIAHRAPATRRGARRLQAAQAKLVIAKLDRLSRNLAFIATLI
jgi:Resolvase, N terminal domain